MLKKEKRIGTLVLLFIACILLCSEYSKPFADMVGAQIGNTVVIFSSTETVMEEGEFNISTTVSDTHRIIISDLHPRAEYDVLVNGAIFAASETSSAAGLLDFSLPLLSGLTYLVSIDTVGLLYPMYPGWNLISIPIQLSDDNIDAALDSIAGNYSSVWTWTCDPTYPDGGYWELYVPGMPIVSDLATLKAGDGYWINMTDSDVLTLSGEEASDEPILLKPGWNLVGYKSLTAKPVEDALSSIAGHFDSVWAWICDPTHADGGYWRLYSPNNPLISDLQTLEPWMGIWIDAIDEWAWDVNASGP